MSDKVNLDSTLDASAAVISIIGNTAEVALRVGNVALPILQAVGLLLPPAGVAANYVSVALPWIAKIAQYAPAVSAGLQQNKSLIESAVGVGEALLGPLAQLHAEIPGLAQSNVFFAELLQRSEFTPLDPRFSRVDSANVGG